MFAHSSKLIVCVHAHRYGVGYHLTLVKTPSCDTGRLSHMITSTVPGSQLASDVSAELTFLLPFTSSQHFPTLLDTLESKMAPPVPPLFSSLPLFMSSFSLFFFLRNHTFSLSHWSLFSRFVPSRNLGTR